MFQLPKRVEKTTTTGRFSRKVALRHELGAVETVRLVRAVPNINDVSCKRKIDHIVVNSG